MFELNNTHRQALLNRLSKANDKLSTIEGCIREDTSTRNLFEIDEFLINKEIELITESLIKNEIDY